MRVPIYASIAVIAVALGIGWRDHQRLTAARQDLASLVREAHGATPSSTSSSPDTRRTREEIQKVAAQLASEWMDYLQKVESLKQQQPPSEPDAAMQERECELWDRSRQLTVTGWESFISRLLDTTDVPDTVRRDLTNHAISTLAKIDPLSALTMIERAAPLFAGDHRARHLLDMAIYQLARQDPLAAADRLRHPGQNLAAFVTEQTSVSLVIGTSRKDLALAFRFLDEIEFKDRYHAIRSLGESPSTPEQKTAVLNELRKQLPTITDSNKRAQTSRTILSALASTFAYGNFAEARQWFESAKLSHAELAICAEQLQTSLLRPETGLWIEWFGSQLSPEDSRRIIDDAMCSWTENDHQAAARWLSTATDGPVKNSAIVGYVIAAAEHEPETAARWAITLPTGDQRTESLQRIYQKWPEEDAPARDAFAKEHGFTWP